MTSNSQSVPRPERIPAVQIRSRKRLDGHAPLVMITAYDAPHARIVEAAGVDMILVGDSVGTTLLGYESTIQVTLDDIVHHARAVRRGASNMHVAADLPFGAYEQSSEVAVVSAIRLMQDGMADSVKLEGGARMADRIREIVNAGIPVIGHVGLLPQTAAASGGMKVRGRTFAEATAIIEDARAVAEAGAIACVLEMIPAELATHITSMLSIPTIGIGSGPGCDGQVLVINDMLGMDERFSPRFLKRYASLETTIRDALMQWSEDVRDGRYPAEEHSFSLPADVAERIAAVSKPAT